MIEKMSNDELEKNCLFLIGKTCSDLGQPNKSDEDKLQLSLSLSVDLKTRYSKFNWDMVDFAFEDGVRDSEEFHLCPRNWCKWLNTMKEKIWNGWYNQENENTHLIDKRLQRILSTQKLIN